MKLCDTCIYGDKYELEKPCVIYSDDCKLYEEKKMDDMTRKRAISELEQIYGMLSSDKQRALDVAINSLQIDEQYDLMYEQAEPKTGHWEWVQYDYHPRLGDWICSECKSVAVVCVRKEEEGGIPLYKYCPQCGARMVEPQESDHKCHTCKHYTSGEHDGSCGSYICKGYSNWESEEISERNMKMWEELFKADREPQEREEI